MYREILEHNSSCLPDAKSWWCKFFYHFSDVNNIVNILNTGMLYSRKAAELTGLMKNDNASRVVIQLTDDATEEYARLYFRPKTPTLFHCEGYKPSGIRDPAMDANCPIPIYLFFDANLMLQMSNVFFTEKTLAGNSNPQKMQGIENFKTLPFAKIYHDSPITSSERDDIIAHRHAEVIVKGGLAIDRPLKAIYCRSKAERQTLLYLLYTTNKDIYKKYKSIIRYTPSINTNLFFHNGLYINEVLFGAKTAKIIFNGCSGRYNRKRIPETQIGISIFLRWYNNKNIMLGQANLKDYPINYQNVEVLDINLPIMDADNMEVQICFDNNNLMYFDKIDLNSTMLF